MGVLVALGELATFVRVDDHWLCIILFFGLLLTVMCAERLKFASVQVEKYIASPQHPTTTTTRVCHQPSMLVPTNVHQRESQW